MNKNLLAALAVAMLAPIMAESGAADFPPEEPYVPQVTHYTRALLDRGGWINPYVAGREVSSGNYLLSVPIGEGVTLVAPE